jgi:AcrR family transcriptional regulator
MSIMIPNNLDSQRKAPQQGRSKVLVESILEATIRILPKIGSRKVTTKKIADLAGVSIGSLYQYFPNKQSVLATLMDIAMKLQTAETHKKLQEISGKSIDDSVSTMVDFALDLFLKEREKNREVFLQAPELGRVPALFKLRQTVVDQLAGEMEKHHPGLEKSDYVRVSFIAVNSIMGVINTMLYDEAQNYSMAELSLELKCMLKSYFQSRIKD